MVLVRCFCAVNLSEEVRNNIAVFQSDLKRNIPNVSWVKKGNFHITLKFLGEKRNVEIDRISDVLSKVSTRLMAFNIVFGSLGFFPAPLRPRVIWVGLRSGAEEMIELNKHIEDNLAKIKIRRDSKFHPHITLGRIRKWVLNEDECRELINQNQQSDFGSLRVKSVSLMRSTLKSTGAEYSEIGSFDLIET